MFALVRHIIVSYLLLAPRKCTLAPVPGGGGGGGNRSGAKTQQMTASLTGVDRVVRFCSSFAI